MLLHILEFLVHKYNQLDIVRTFTLAIQIKIIIFRKISAQVFRTKPMFGCRYAIIIILSLFTCIRNSYIFRWIYDTDTYHGAQLAECQSNYIVDIDWIKGKSLYYLYSILNWIILCIKLINCITFSLISNVQVAIINILIANFLSFWFLIDSV